MKAGRRHLLGMFARLVAMAITLFARLVTAPRVIWRETGPRTGPCVYFANHSSNGDFVLIWAVLPSVLRVQTRPVAALDYWLVNPLRRFVGREVFRAVLIDRRPEARTQDPVAQMLAAIDEGSALILFPEGKRNTTDEPLLPFRSGLYHVARARPDIDLVPVWIANLNKVMPKGAIIPVPLLCTVTFGPRLRVTQGEEKDAFLARMSTALLDLSAGAQ